MQGFEEVRSRSPKADYRCWSSKLQYSEESWHIVRIGVELDFRLGRTTFERRMDYAVASDLRKSTQLLVGHYEFARLL